jgi:signal peptidase I
VIQQLRRSPHGTWVRPVLSAAARTLLCAAAGLLLWTQAPLLVGWFPALVASGSMSPHVMPGDVLVYQHGGHPRKGQVVLFHDPARPARLISHRVERVLPSGALVTKGDANATPDSTHVPRRLYAGLARLRVPLIGLPALWWRQHAYLALASALAAAIVVTHLALPRPRRTPRPSAR